jgi:hypothetical protein
MNYKSEMIHRRVPLINSLELQLEEERRQLRVIRRINDKVDIQHENGVYCIKPCNDKKECGSNGFVHFELNDFDGIQNSINQLFCKEQKSADVYRCYKRCCLEENELFGLHLENTDHSILYAKTTIPVERYQLNTNNFLLPNFPLFQNDQGKELWEPCCNLLHIRAKGDDYSDNDDDYNFLY